jgi:predicted naringenin-chalcone synthase
MSRDGVESPVLAVPEIVFPETTVGHDEVVAEVGRQYAPLCALHPDDAEYQRSFTAAAQTALHMASALNIDTHPAHLSMEQMTRSRGLGERNREAMDAFNLYVPDAAKHALATAQVSPEDIDAVLVASSTVLSMPALPYQLVEMMGLRPSVDVIPIHFMGCTGGGHAIIRGRDYLLAHPDRNLLIIAADYASPHFHLEPDLRGVELRGSMVSSTLFSDATAAAVMFGGGRGSGFRITGSSSFLVPGTENAMQWAVTDTGLHFRLSDMAVKQIPQLIPSLVALLDEQGWSVEDLTVCSFHTGGNRIIDNIQEGLGLTDTQIRPTRLALRYGNTMSVAVFHALQIISADPTYQPLQTARGIGAGYGPGFSCCAFTWEFQNPTQPHHHQPN